MGHIRRDGISHEDIYGKMRVTFVVDKIHEVTLTWFRYVKKRNTNTLVRRGEKLMIIDLKRGRDKSIKNYGEMIY